MAKLPPLHHHPSSENHRRPLRRSPFRRRRLVEATKGRQGEVEKSLRAIYTQRDGRAPDLRVLERTRRRRWPWRWMACIGVGALAMFAIWTASFLLRPLQDFDGRGLGLQIQGPDQVTLGQEETFTMKWSNEDTRLLTQAEIRVSLPQDFVITALEPEPTEPALHLWKLGLIPVGGQGVITVRGVFQGALNTETALQVIGTYRPAGFARDFERLVVQPLVYQKSVLQGSLELPPKVLSGDIFPLTYRIVNQGTRAISGLVTHVRFPDGFILNATSSSLISQDAREIFLPITTLAPHASTTIQLTGSFTSGVSGEAVFYLQTGRRNERSEFVAAQKTEGRLPVVAGDLAIRLVVNGSGKDQSLSPEDPLRVTLGYQNTSPEKIKGVTLELGFETIMDGRSVTGTSLLDWSKLDDATQGVSTTRTRVQTLRYGKKQIPHLESLAPQVEGTIEISLPTLPAASGTKDAVIRITAQAEILSVGGTKLRRVVSAQPIQARYRSDADVRIEARYFTEEGAPLGSGPLPPVAGKTTAYRVIWRLGKTLHPLEQMIVSAELPKIGAWSNRSSADAGSVTYDASTRVVRWTLDHVPDKVKDLEATFEVQLTPSIFDVGRFATVLGETKFRAQDPVVNEILMRVKPPLSTDLQNDEGARGKGVVRKE